ncbi:MAG: YebC/PmpR family DNA-binding transcriptional regulator [bacterium]|nr:YebC/PmpR family DNA-binding transcriptional regulator [bacterium]MDZ4248291.1 YebC/PmpR family DNA-binding transcriptional regulator [Patescibacteria group bacterium]
MSGHSKWSTIKRKKGAADAKRGAVFTRLANLISIAAREGGGDPGMNVQLRMAIDQARAENMPNANVERAIKRGTGELAGQRPPESVTYEAYGPGGVALLVDCLTDNKNRTVSDVRAAVTKRGGSLGESGSVAYLFDEKGILKVGADADEDELTLAAADAGATDVDAGDGAYEVETGRQDLAKVRDALTAAGFPVQGAELAKVPKSEVPVNDRKTAESIVALVNDLESLDDVSDVSTNADIEPELVGG